MYVINYILYVYSLNLFIKHYYMWFMIICSIDPCVKWCEVFLLKYVHIIGIFTHRYTWRAHVHILFVDVYRCYVYIHAVIYLPCTMTCQVYEHTSLTKMHINTCFGDFWFMVALVGRWSNDCGLTQDVFCSHPKTSKSLGWHAHNCQRIKLVLS